MAHVIPLTPEQLAAQQPRLGSAAQSMAVGAGSVGVLALAAAVVWGAAAGDGLRSLLFHLQWNLVFFVSISLGGLFFILLHYVTKASWSVVVRRLAEYVAGALFVLLPLLLLVSFADVLGTKQLYYWADAARVAGDAVLAHKAPYLNPVFFVIRWLVIAAVWLGLVRYFGGQSRRQDASGDPAPTLRMWTLAAPAMLLFALTLTLFAVDMLMSLDAHWFSTIFGVYVFAGCVIGALATISLASIFVQSRGHLRGAVTAEHYHDLGKLLFAFVFFWGYIAFSQFMLYWYGNMPEETIWFIRRFSGDWLPLSYGLLFFHLLIPFTILLSRMVKRRKRLLAVMCVWMLAAHWLDIYWLVMPELVSGSAQAQRLVLSPLALLTFVGVGGMWLAAFSWQAARSPLVPLGDPLLAESLKFENV